MADLNSNLKDLFAQAVTALMGPSSAQAYSRVTRSPIYQYNNPGSARGGFQTPNGVIAINTPSLAQDYNQGGNNVQQTIRHESVHKILEPVLQILAKARPGQKYEPDVANFLKANSNVYGDNPDVNQIYTEGMAYGAQRQPKMPVPNDFVNSVLQYLQNNGQGAVANQYQRLTGDQQ